MLSNYLAEIWGISIVIVSLALLLKERLIKVLLGYIGTELGMMLCGVFSVVLGVVQVLSHNIWVKNWQVLVTILGWVLLVKGLFQLFMPEQCMAWLKKMENSQFLPYGLVVALVLGLVITYFGFTA